MNLSPGHLSASDRVLMVRLGAVGDVLRTLPAIHLIRQSFPSTHLAWIVEDLSRGLLEDHPEIDEVIRFPLRELQAAVPHPGRLATALKALRATLHRRRFTVAIDAQGSFKSGMVAMLSGARRRIGFAPGQCREMSFLFTNRWVRLPSPRINRVEQAIRLAEALGAVGDEVSMVLGEAPAEAREAESILKQLVPDGRPVVLLSPGASRRQRHKKWPAPRYAQLATLLRRSLGVVPVIAWGPGEEALARSIVDGSDGCSVLPPQVGLRMLAAMLRRSSLFVGADTGPMHLAWGVGCPVIALFGPTDPQLNAPLGRDHIVLRCGSTVDAIEPETVLSAARSILDQVKSVRPTTPPPALSRADLARITP